MERGDIYLVSLDPTSGHEQQGIRPVLVVSPTPFNRLTKTPIMLPITSGGNFARTAGFPSHLWEQEPPPRVSSDVINLARLICIPGEVESWKASRPPLWKKCWHGWHRSLSELAEERAVKFDGRHRVSDGYESICK